MRDRHKIEELYRLHGPALVLFATSISGCRGSGQDAVHQVFLKLLDKGVNDRVADLKAYLFASVRNTALNEIKRYDRMAELDPDSAWFDPPDHDSAAERNLQVALRGLPEDQRQVVIMHLWGELTFAQIGEILNISANTAASRYRYALNRLRERLSAKEGCDVQLGRRTV